MKKRNLRNIGVTIGLFASFILWTVAITILDVQAIGPNGSSVGFATFNGLFHKLTGVSLKKPKEALKHQKGAQKQAVRRAAKKYIKVGELNCRHRQSHHGRYNLSSLIELIPLIWKLLQNAQSVYQQGSL